MARLQYTLLCPELPLIAWSHILGHSWDSLVRLSLAWDYWSNWWHRCKHNKMLQEDSELFDILWYGSVWGGSKWLARMAFSQTGGKERKGWLTFKLYWGGLIGVIVYHQMPDANKGYSAHCKKEGHKIRLGMRQAIESLRITHGPRR